MIKQGTKGSICFYYEGLLISGFPLNKTRTTNGYLFQGEYLIRISKGIPIMTQIKTYTHFCNVMHTRKREGLPIRRSDHELFISSLTALMRLNIIDNDDMNGYLEFPPKLL
jgi:hypothetical protein